MATKRTRCTESELLPTCQRIVTCCMDNEMHGDLVPLKASPAFAFHHATSVTIVRLTLTANISGVCNLTERRNNLMNIGGVQMHPTMTP